MTAGVEITNPSGTIMLDNNLANMFLAQKTTHTPAAGANLVVTYTGQAGSMPLCALSFTTASGTLALYSTVRVGNTWTWTFLSSLVSSITITAFVFDRQFSASGPGFGLQVFDAAGNMTYNSAINPMKISQIISGNLPGGQLTTPTTQTLTAGPTYAVVQCNYAGGIYIDTIPPARTTEALFSWAMGWGFNANVLRYTGIVQSSSSPPQPLGTYSSADERDYKPYTILLLDVTDY